MLQLILMLLGLAFSNNNDNTANNDNSQNPVTVQSNSGESSDPGTDPGTSEGGPVGGETTQTPPRK